MMEGLAEAARNQSGTARHGLESADDGFHKDLGRSRQNLARPTEVINSLNLLARAHVVDAISSRRSARKCSG
jgi:hypothetical protein